MGFFSDQGAYATNAADEPRDLNRLDRRYDHIFRPNLLHIRGKRVLDLASHDGHWSFAALRSGAAYVLGVEGRRDLVDRAVRIFVDHRLDPERYGFVCADVFDALESLRQPFDTILCLGIFYHVLDHLRLMRLMADRKPEAILLDTAVAVDEEPLIRLRREKTARAVNAIPRYGGQTDALTGLVSRSALALLAAEVGYSVSPIDWDFEKIANPEGVRDYQAGRRMTAVLRPLSGRSESA